MSAAQNLQVQLLLVKSAEDEATLAFAVPDSIFEFHTQQAVEKLLKSLIAAHNVVHPFTHDLQALINQLIGLGEELPVFPIPLGFFTPFGVSSRYDAGVSLSGVERQQYREIVEQLRLFVTGRIAVLP